ncbi:cysteine proteinase [Auriculariales sp. MPI-PUGE-AT-0066]|nr:cysteine proteinase [Auriculariales sp. MPI-PUGE-AT-0066]
MQQPDNYQDEKQGQPPANNEDEQPVSVKEHDLFAARHMPDLGYDVNEFKVLHWRLDGWKKLDKKLTSPDFECGGHIWRILLFPFGNSTAPQNDTVSVYLDYANPKDAPEGWHACAQFALVISSVNDPTNFIVSNAHHRFIAEESDWGFTRFTELRKLQYPQDPQSRPILEGDAAEISVFVRVLEDPTGVLWHNFVNYDSKKETGYVGMKNQGATCYMNSLLQSLYCTNYFRRAVYQIPTQDDTPSQSVALALQRVFYNLQTSDQPVGTNELTKSFGWTSLDSFMQHDVQEFSRVLMDKLEAKMKGTIADGTVTKLFVGKMKSYVKCIDVDFESSRVEDFNDISLNVKGMKTLRESFLDYISVETLDGDNKYQAEGHGLQDAKKGIVFESFPPVLHLQLKRFEYDMQRDTMVKINDRFEFPFEIDLQEFLHSEADTSQPWVYRLTGVLVHSGDLHGGHYFALIKPDRQTRWLKFDDDRVTPVTDREVLEENYGGEALNGHVPVQAQRNQPRAMKRFTNAYMLVYARESAMDDVLAPFTEKDTPAHLKQRLEEERLANENKRREKEEQHLFLTAKIITDESFSKHDGFDLATFDEKHWPATELPSFRILKTEPYPVFKGRISKTFNIPENQIRLWVLVNRQNKTVRPDVPVPETEPNLTVESIRTNMAARQTDLRLYLDVIADPAKPDPQPNHIMVFLKYFDVEKQKVVGAGRAYVSRTSKVGDLTAIINERMRWAPTMIIKLYEEIKPGMIEVMKPKQTFAQSEIQDGDIICFQAELPENEIRDLEVQGMYATPPQYYDFLQNRVLISFKPKNEEISEENPEFDLILSKKMNYETMAQKAGDTLKHDPIKLRFTTTQSNGTPKSILKRSLNQSVSDIMSPHYTTQQSTVILYERLDVSIVELETKRSLKVVWTGIHNKEEGTHPFLLPKTSTVHELATQLAKLVSLTPDGSNTIRVFEMSKDGKHQREFSATEMIGNIPEVAELYAEEIPLDELDQADDKKIISVFHFFKDPSRPHGVPFRFVLKPGEKFVDTKKRLQARLGVTDKDIARFRFALIQVQQFKQPSYIEDDDAIYEHKFQPDDVLGLDHIDKTGKSRPGAGERAIVIKG